MRQLFIANQDRDRIYPLEKEFIHTTAQLVDGVCVGIQIRLAGLLLGVCDSVKQARRVVRMIQGFGGRNGAVFLMPGFCNYNSKSDWLNLLAIYQEIEEKEN